MVTKGGLPLGYEAFHGNRAEPTTLDVFEKRWERGLSPRATQLPARVT